MSKSLRQLKEDIENKRDAFQKFVDQDDFDTAKAEKMESEIKDLKQDYENKKQKWGAQADPLNQTERNMSNSIYNSAENIYTQDSNDLHIYDYMEAVMDKPQTAKQYEAIQNSVTSDGYTLPSSVSQQLIDRLRATNPVIQAGAQTAVLDSPEKNWVKIESDPQSYFHEELNEEPNASGSFSSIKMEPKTLMTVVEVSRELLQDSNNAGQAITTAMVGSLNDKLLNATFVSSGSTQPTGLDTLISQTQTYSGSINYDSFVKANRKLYDANVSESNRSMIHSTQSYEDLTLAKDTTGRYLEAPESLQKLASYTSTGVPQTQSYIADFSNFVYGYSLNVTIEKYNSASVNKYGTKFLAVIRYDQNVIHPKSFVRVSQ